MASVNMMASFISGTAIVQQSTNTRRALFATKASYADKAQALSLDRKEAMPSVDGRRALVLFAAAAAALAGSGMAAFAEEDAPKRGTPEARKKFAPICVTMPTARVCNKIA